MPEDIIREVAGMIAAGYKDITLLGQNVNSYGKDLGLGVDFADLLKTLFGAARGLYSPVYDQPSQGRIEKAL